MRKWRRVFTDKVFPAVKYKGQNERRKSTTSETRYRVFPFDLTAFLFLMFSFLGGALQ